MGILLLKGLHFAINAAVFLMALFTSVSVSSRVLCITVLLCRVEY